MRPILVGIVVAVGLVWFARPALASEARQGDEPPMHKHLETTVEKIRSGLVFFRPTAGLQNRAVSVHKAERMGLNEAKEGDAVILVIDESNLLIDLHRKGVQPAGHTLIGGKLTYADPFWEVIEITNAEGKQTFAMDEASGSKLSLLREGNPVVAELNEDNEVVDIHQTR
jgi:hypothetical protein